MNNRPFHAKDHRQTDGYSCGSTSAQVALELAGWPERLAVRQVAHRLATTQMDGTDPRTLESFFRVIGCEVQSGEMDLTDLAYHTRRRRPIVCLYRLDDCGHWVSVYAATTRRVWFHCPVLGLCTVPGREFRENWHDTGRGGESYPRFGIVVLRG